MALLINKQRIVLGVIGWLWRVIPIAVKPCRRGVLTICGQSLGINFTRE